MGVDDHPALGDALITLVQRWRGPSFLGEQLTLADITLAPFIPRLYLLEEHRGFSLHKDNAELKSK
jgi:glutathione S-transferase